MLKVKSWAISALAHIVGISSFYIILLYLADLEYPKLLLISAKTGEILFPFSKYSFLISCTWVIVSNLHSSPVTELVTNYRVI